MVCFVSLDELYTCTYTLGVRYRKYHPVVWLHTLPVHISSDHSFPLELEFWNHSSMLSEHWRRDTTAQRPTCSADVNLKYFVAGPVLASAGRVSCTCGRSLDATQDPLFGEGEIAPSQPSRPTTVVPFWCLALPALPAHSSQLHRI